MVGVKALVDSGIESLPDSYWQNVQDALGDADVVELPVIDISKDKTSAVREMHKACQEWGAFQLLGHGVSSDLMESMTGLVRMFFDLPLEERLAFYCEDFTLDDKQKPVRFYAGGESRLWYDFIFNLCNPMFKEEDVPKNVPGYLEITSEYVKKMCCLAKNLLGHFSEALGLEVDILEKKLVDPTHGLLMNYYPPCPKPDKAVGLDKHTDSGAVTILQQDEQVEGLQILRGSRWLTVKPVSGAFVINMGDQMEILTNGVYKSLVHRSMVNSSKTRITLATFYNPNVSTCIEPILANPAPLYKGCKYGDYLELYKTIVFSKVPAIELMKINASKENNGKQY